MDTYYDEKQNHRQKEINSKRLLHRKDDRQYKKTGNKRSKLVRDVTGDFHPDDGRYSVQCTESPFLRSEISVISDDGTNDLVEYQAMIPSMNENQNNNMFSSTEMETSINRLSEDILNLADWIKTDRELVVTPLDRRYQNYRSMQYKCRKAQPVVDTTIYYDFQRAFDNVSSIQLSKMIYCFWKLPVFICSKNDQINEAKNKFMLDHKLTKEQLFRMNDICQQILYRSSYGVLFLKDTKFFAKVSQHTNKIRSGIKGYSHLKPNGEWENPWETTVRITIKHIEYRNGENEEWQSFDMDEHIKENERLNYLECLVQGVNNATYDRYIGMFVIRLKPNIQIRTKNNLASDGNDDWYLINDQECKRSKFYTIYPFIQYIQQNPDFI